MRGQSRSRNSPVGQDRLLLIASSSSGNSSDGRFRRRGEPSAALVGAEREDPARQHQAQFRHRSSLTDPKRSVLDTNFKAHDPDNLDVDPSFSPSSSAVDPSLTAIADALQEGDHPIDRPGVRVAANGLA